VTAHGCVYYHYIPITIQLTTKYVRGIQ